jgi:hypothetical protein
VIRALNGHVIRQCRKAFDAVSCQRATAPGVMLTGAQPTQSYPRHVSELPICSPDAIDWTEKAPSQTSNKRNTARP